MERTERKMDNQEKTEESRHQPMFNRGDEKTEETVIIHRIDLADWYATQFGRSVEVYERASETPARVFYPPKGWGHAWGWNVCDEGVYFRRG